VGFKVEVVFPPVIGFPNHTQLNSFSWFSFVLRRVGPRPVGGSELESEPTGVRVFKVKM